MAYRRDSQKAQEWRKWLLKNQAALDRCGIPEFILEDELSWFVFLDHGFYGNRQDRNQFQLEDLSAKQLQELYAFLNRELSADEKGSTVAFSLVKSMVNKSS
jgi:hypothetical protein